MNKKKELRLDELDEVVGGVNTKRKCSYFLQARNKANINSCLNCFYTNKIKGKTACTHPSMKKLNSKDVM